MARWLLWTLLTVLAWGIWAILAKLLGNEIPSPAQSQAASTLGIVPVVVMLWFMKEEPVGGNRRRGVLLALGSGVVSCLGNIAFFDAYARGGNAADVVPLTALYPAVTVLLAVPLLKERLSWLQWFGVGLSMAAIYLFNVPGESGLVSGWLLYALIPIVLWGICGLMQKMSTNDISARSSAIWFLLAFVPVGAYIALADPLPSGIPVKTWVLATVVGFTLAIGNFTILQAFAAGGKASIISPMAGLYFLVSIPIAMLALGEQIGLRSWLGIACALAAVVTISYQAEPETGPTITLDPDVSR